MSISPTPVVTCTVYRESQFLVIRRHNKAKKFGGLWSFPGGKVEIGETVATSLIREVKEETNLILEDKTWFIDSYYYGDSVGLHFAVFAKPGKVVCEPGVEHKWITSLNELQTMPRIPGIDFHIVQAQEYMSTGLSFSSLSSIDYTPNKYIN